MEHISDAEYREYSDAQDAALERPISRRLRDACRCGTDMPGRCPGPQDCPMCEEDEND